MKRFTLMQRIQIALEFVGAALITGSAVTFGAAVLGYLFAIAEWTYRWTYMLIYNIWF